MHRTAHAAALAGALAFVLTACAPGALEAASAPSPTVEAAPSPTSSATPTSEPTPEPTPTPTPALAPWTPSDLDTSGWQTFTMPGGTATFRMPADWWIASAHPLDPTLPSPESAGYAHVYSADGEHVLGLSLRTEPYRYDFCDQGPDARFEVLHEEPIDIGASSLHESPRMQLRIDGEVAASISLTDGWTQGGMCARDAEVDIVPTASGIAAVEFGTGSSGASIISPPSFSGPFPDSVSPLALVDLEKLDIAWSIVRSLEIS